MPFIKLCYFHREGWLQWIASLFNPFLSYKTQLSCAVSSLDVVHLLCCCDFIFTIFFSQLCFKYFSKEGGTHRKFSALVSYNLEMKQNEVLDVFTNTGSQWFLVQFYIHTCMHTQKGRREGRNETDRK